MLPSAAMYRMYCGCFALLGFSCLLCPFLLPASHAQITLDGSLGPRGALQGPRYEIPAEVGQLRGGNLFHSFGQFNIQRGERATFTGPAAVDNIFSRVTGGSRSRIDGTLQSDIPGASLYLLNPSGVMFGPHAQLNVSGSFHVSTANRIRLSDGATFSANLSEKTRLTCAPPVAFGFLDRHPAGITMQGSQLSVQEGKTFSVTGGDITLTNKAMVFSGTSSEMPGGDILIRANALTMRTGSGITSYTTAAESAGDAGNIRVDAQTVTIRGSSFLSSVTLGAGRSGNVKVTATTLVMDGRVEGFSSEISTRSETRATGPAGSVRVEAQTVSLTNGAQIQSATFGAGPGGALTVIAHDAITLDGFGIGLTASGQEDFAPSLIGTTSQQRATGPAGSVRVEAQTVSLTNGAQIQSGTFGAGRGGALTVIAHDAVTLDGFGGGLLSLITASSESKAIGDAGSVRVEAQTVTATNGAQINSVTFGAGQGGSVTVIARDRVTFHGTSPEGEKLLGVLVPGDRTFPSGANANSHGTGAPGIVHVTAPKVMLAAGGRISSANITSKRAGGTVIVQAADTLEIAGMGSSLRTRSFGPGPGGDITVNAGTVLLTDGADLSAASTPRGDAQGSGNAGNIQVTASKNLLIQNSSVTTAATQADGGNITLRVHDMIRLQDSQITARVSGGEGAGGNITIDPAAEFVVLEGSQLNASAIGGPGGNITIKAGVFLSDPASSITASSDRNVPGEINIQAAITNLSGLVTPLTPDFAPVGALLHDPCTARLRAGTVSSFVVRGRASFPATYDGPLHSRLYESPQHRTPPTGAGHPRRETTAASQVPLGSAGTRSLLWLDLPCARP